MHECPNCGTMLTAPPSHCYEPAKPLSMNVKRGLSGLTLLAFAGVAIATAVILGRFLIG